MNVNIRVVPRIFFEKIKGTPFEKEIVEKSWIVSINSSSRISFGEEEKPPFSDESLSTGRILPVVFDDIETEEQRHDYSPPLVLMTDASALRILRFADEIKTGDNVLVHCTAGISRSGAVGEVLNMHFNDGSREFYDKNSHIIPNTHVKSTMMRVFGLTYQPESGW